MSRALSTFAAAVCAGLALTNALVGRPFAAGIGMAIAVGNALIALGSLE